MSKKDRVAGVTPDGDVVTPSDALAKVAALDWCSIGLHDYLVEYHSNADGDVAPRSRICLRCGDEQEWVLSFGGT